MAKKLNFHKVRRIPIMHLSKEDAKTFFAALLNPPKPTPAMIAAFQEVQQWFK